MDRKLKRLLSVAIALMVFIPALSGMKCTAEQQGFVLAEDYVEIAAEDEAVLEDTVVEAILDEEETDINPIDEVIVDDTDFILDDTFADDSFLETVDDYADLDVSAIDGFFPDVEFVEEVTMDLADALEDDQPDQPEDEQIAVGFDEPTPEDTSIISSAEVDGVRFTLKASKGVYAEGTSLLVQRIDDEEFYTAADQALAVSDENVIAHFTYHIELVDEEGTPVSPAIGETTLTIDGIPEGMWAVRYYAGDASLPETIDTKGEGKIEFPLNRTGLYDFIALIMDESIDETPEELEEAIDVAEESAENQFHSATVTDEIRSNKGLDNDALFEGFIRSVLPGLETGRRPRGGSGNAGSRLSGLTRELYDRLKEKVILVAAGEYSGPTEFTFLQNELSNSRGYTAEELNLTSLLNTQGKFSDAIDAVLEKLGVDIDAALDALRSDCPYELYWYNKLSTPLGFGISYTTLTDGTPYQLFVRSVSITMPVAQGYQGSDNVHTNATLPQKVNNAATEIASIISTYRTYDDYNKLLAYKNKICDLVDYNFPAAQNSNTPYGDPWQLVYVFDGDPTTSVVCEGYSKAFKYLCDLSSFQDPVECILASGLMGGVNEAGGGHMWNIVSMPDDRNYLVDVTNCDSAYDSEEETYVYMVGYPDNLFLKGYSTKDTSSHYQYVGNAVFYEYYTSQNNASEDMFAIHGAEWLALSNDNYGATHQVAIPGTSGGTVSASTTVAQFGTTITLTVSPDPGYILDENNLSVTYIDDMGCNTSVELSAGVPNKYTFTMPAYNVTVSAAFVSQPAIAYYSLLLGDQLGMMFYVNMPGDQSQYDGSYMEFTVSGDKTTETITEARARNITNNGALAFICYVNSIQMADGIQADFHYGNGQTVTKTCSVNTYIGMLKEAQIDQTTLALAKAIQNYGYYAQVYLDSIRNWSVGTDYAEMTPDSAITSADISAAQAAVADKSLTYDLTGTGIVGVSYSLNLDSKTAINLYLAREDGFAGEITATLNGQSVDVVHTAYGECIRIEGISAHELGTDYTVTVQGQNPFTIQVSALAYVRSILNGNYGQLAKNAVTALYNYYSATIDYRTSQQ